MNHSNLFRKQTGVALVFSLLFLLVVTGISVTAAMNSALALSMSANMQDRYNSFQSAEAGIFATLGLVSSANEPFTRTPKRAPFDGIAAGDHPLRNLRDGAVSVDTQVFLTASARPCPRPAGEGGGSSVGTFDCDYYRIESEHDVPSRARTKVKMGVVKMVIGENG
jgi:type IV pilus assembly protein PilX